MMEFIVNRGRPISDKLGEFERQACPDVCLETASITCSFHMRHFELQRAEGVSYRYASSEDVALES